MSFVSLQAVSADDIYVNPQAAGEGSGTIDNPYSNIQLAMDNARDNSVINLMPGSYSGVNNSDLTVKVNNLTITSYRGPAIFTPVVDSAPTRYFNITGSNVVLNGLTFISGVSMAYEDTVGGEVIINAQNVIVNNTKFINSVSQEEHYMLPHKAQSSRIPYLTTIQSMSVTVLELMLNLRNYL